MISPPLVYANGNLPLYATKKETSNLSLRLNKLKINANLSADWIQLARALRNVRETVGQSVIIKYHR